MISILIAEDDIDISNMLTDLLTRQGYECTAAYSGTEALLLLDRQSFSLILLDLMLPGKSGAEVLGHLRSGSAASTPVIAVSAVTAVTSKVELLGLGADDYVTKPFDNDELLARIQVQLRRKDSSSLASPSALAYADLLIDKESMRASVAGKTLPLTKRELLILELLMETPHKVFTKSNIYESVWGEDLWGDDSTVNVHISNLRQKIAKISPDKQYIQTVWGIGFKMSDSIVKKHEIE